MKPRGPISRGQATSPSSDAMPMGPMALGPWLRRAEPCGAGTRIEEEGPDESVETGARQPNRWEYLVVPLADAGGLKKKSADLRPDHLDELGSQGWEAVGLSLKYGDLIAWPVVLRKRPVTSMRRGLRRSRRRPLVQCGCQGATDEPVDRCADSGINGDERSVRMPGRGALSLRHRQPLYERVNA